MNSVFPFLNKSSEHQSSYSPEEAFFCSRSFFIQMLRIERKRSERSKKNFVLLLMDITEFLKRRHPYKAKDVITGFSRILRETDIRGWYNEGHIIGVILPEMDDQNNVKKVIQKISNQLSYKFGSELSSQITFSYLISPEVGPMSKREQAIKSALVQISV
jgi:hypothetical protein